MGTCGVIFVFGKKIENKLHNKKIFRRNFKIRKITFLDCGIFVFYSHRPFVFPPPIVLPSLCLCFRRKSHFPWVAALWESGLFGEDRTLRVWFFLFSKFTKIFFSFIIYFLFFNIKFILYARMWSFSASITVHWSYCWYLSPGFSSWVRSIFLFSS